MNTDQSGNQTVKQKKERSHLVRALLLVLGIIASVLGFAGIFIPLLPTTPFLLLASWCFVRSSDKLNKMLMGNRYLGPYLSNYKAGHGITRRNKVYSLLFLWITLSVSFFLSPPYWWLRLGLLTIGIAITIHIMKFKTLKR
ncbi:MAG: DUF454 domain-containing protein [Bacteroidetes bacterium HGW-Bacteroidetes-9]|jgi:hypothetical protein|nr:MAG: DUF454 domain-containing protein [Bacteroidetes bacterium HGW-Bacteroidetes-9]